MSFDSVQVERLGGAWSALETLIDSDGSAQHPQIARLAKAGAPLRDLADAVHLVAMLHARHPGVIDIAAERADNPAAAGWLGAAAEAFADERALVVRLVTAAGPLPRTPGQAESEATVSAQRHALDMLANSDRSGCATGAALALALDWGAFRSVLDAAAARLGVDLPETELPPVFETATVVQAIDQGGPIERAMLFGAQQLLAQHRGLWDLLEARSSARERQ